MKQILLCLLLAAAGARAERRDEEPKLHQGDWRVGGSLAITSNSFSNGDSAFLVSASLPIQYFLVDRLSAGLSVNWTTTNTTTSAGSSSSTVVSGGAEATWYFWQYKGLASFIEPELFVNTRSNGGPTTYSAAGALGLEVFLNSSVAIGPGFVYLHEFGTGTVSSADSYRFFAQLFIYL